MVSKESLQKRRAYAARTTLATNAAEWDVIRANKQNGKHVRPSRKKRNDARLQQYRAKLASNQGNEHIQEQLLGVEPLKAEDNTGSSPMKKISSITPGEAWHLQQSKDRNEVGNPSVWGSYQGLIDIYRKHKHTDDVGMIRMRQERLMKHES